MLTTGQLDERQKRSGFPILRQLPKDDPSQSVQAGRTRSAYLRRLATQLGGIPDDARPAAVRARVYPRRSIDTSR
jgi:hypothetical protein